MLYLAFICLMYFSLLAADEEHEVVQKSKQAKKNESKTVIDDGKDNEHYKDKPAEVNSEVTQKDAHDESVKPEEVPTEVGTAQSPSGKEGVLFSNEEVTMSQNQEETKAVDEK